MRCARLTVSTLLFGLGSCLVATSLEAHESTGTPVARAIFSEGEAATRAGKHAEAAAAFRRAIEADPDFGEAHQRFIESMRRLEAPSSRTPSLPQIEQLYSQWASFNPTRAAYQWALGFLAHEPAKADVFFRAALKLDPAFARAHASLARNADLRGDWAAQRRHLEGAVQSKPDDPQYLLRYALAHRTDDPKRFRELALSVVEKFPGTTWAAEALYQLANNSSDSERRGYFERLRADYPPDKFTWASSAMSSYYGELTAPSEALALAKEMMKALPANKTWPARAAHQEAMTRIEALVAERKFTEALDAIEKTQRPSGRHATTWVMLKAQAAAGAGRADLAYDTLLDSVAPAPEDRAHAALVEHGAALKKSPQQVDADLWRIRDGKAAAAAPFELPGTRDGKPVRLSDYRGRVVLLAFWFPG